MEIITIKRRKHTGEVDKHGAEPESRGDIYGGSPDTDYMKNCRAVDLNPPKTWEKYDIETPAGVKKVIEMEYKELMSATTPEETEENIYHLSVALLRLWRLHHDHGTKHTGTT